MERQKFQIVINVSYDSPNGLSGRAVSNTLYSVIQDAVDNGILELENSTEVAGFSIDVKEV